MINPKAVAEFLDRPRANSDKAKRFTDAALDRMLARLDPPPEFVFPPYRHQKAAFLLGLKYGSYFYLLDMGLGKSKLMLDLFRYRKRKGLSKRMLVLVPGVANIGSCKRNGGGWGEEVHTHAPELTFQPIDETLSGTERAEAITSGKADVTCITYQGWVHLICKSRTVTRGEKQVSEWTIDEKKAKALQAPFDEIVFDESNSIQNSQSLYYRAARRFLKTAKYRACLTGTPFNKDPISLWSQFFVVDQGASLGAHIGLFRAAFFVQHQNYWSRGVDYEFDSRMEEDLYRVMRHRSIRFSEEECLDLPPKVGGLERPIIRAVEMPKETWKHYERLVDELKGAKGNYQLMESAYMRLRMLCSGYLPMRDEKGKRVDVPLPQNPKLDALVGLLREIPDTKKVIVFHEYRTTGALISERLRKEKIRHVRLFGGTKNKADVVTQFKSDPKVRVLLASKAGAKGHNLQCSHHMAFFESPDDLIHRAQAEKRIRRPGQQHTTYYYDLHITNSVDQRILDALRGGKRLFDALVDGSLDPRSLLRGAQDERKGARDARKGAGRARGGSGA